MVGIGLMSMGGLIWKTESSFKFAHYPTALGASGANYWAGVGFYTEGTAFSPDKSETSQRALGAALKAWGVAAGSIPRPSLWIGQCPSPEVSIACADRPANRIIFNAKYYENPSIDRLSIMLHEVGHLYGVPHISGDPLMDASYGNEHLTEPTPFSIALALVVKRQTAKEKLKP